MAKFRFATDGYFTVMELDGKVIGTGVEKVDFHHETGETAKLSMEIDVCDFQYYEDGSYEKKEAFLMDKSQSRKKHGNQLRETLDESGEA